MVSLMSKKILAIVEGEKKEPEILRRVFDISGLKQREIVPYKTNIYDLYNLYLLHILDFYYYIL